MWEELLLLVNNRKGKLHKIYTKNCNYVSKKSLHFFWKVSQKKLLLKIFSLLKNFYLATQRVRRKQKDIEKNRLLFFP